MMVALESIFEINLRLPDPSTTWHTGLCVGLIQHRVRVEYKAMAWHKDVPVLSLALSWGHLEPS